MMRDREDYPLLCWNTDTMGSVKSAYEKITMKNKNFLINLINKKMR